jgi:hypothetical protein
MTNTNIATDVGGGDRVCEIHLAWGTNEEWYYNDSHAGEIPKN